MNNKLKIIFMGSDIFALHVLKLLHDNERFTINSVYTRAPKMAGRGLKMTKTEVHEFALRYDIPVHTPKSLRNIELESGSDLVIVFSYGLIIPQHFLNIAPFINVHPSLLPKWRGPSPMIYPLLQSEKETGVTIMKMDTGIDTGDILSQEKIEISDDDNYQSLTAKLIKMSGELLIPTIFDYVDGKIVPHKQDDTLATYTKKIDATFLKLNFNANCGEIMGKIRAFSPKPCAFFHIKRKRMKILQAKFKKTDHNHKNGTIIDKNFAITCANGLIFPEIVQLEGKKIMQVKDFLNGFKFIPGDQIDEINQ